MPTIKDVDNFPVPAILVDRIVFLYQVPQEFSEGLLKEAKRLLFLSAAKNTAVAPSERVDWAWHEMLMFTRFYKEFCDSLGTFIHHDPNPPSGEKEKETWDSIQATLGNPRKEAEIYTKTKELYQEFFGQAPDPLYWP